jgi:hypothetical protein
MRIPFCFHSLPALLLMAAASSSGAAPVSSASTAWLHACPAADGGARYRVGDAAHLAGCSGATLALPAGVQVESLYPLAPGEAPETTILLHGNLNDGRFAVSEHDLPSAAARPGDAKPTAMPLRANLLPGMRAQPFGVEERVDARLADGRLHIACRDGSRAAGVVLTGPWFLSRANLALAADATASAPFTWQAADAARAARGAALDLGTTASGAARTRLALPAGLERGAWRQFVVLCPDTAATLDVASLTLEPTGTPGKAGRSTWIWRPGDWIDDGPALLDWAARHGIATLFVTVPLKDGTAVRSPELLADFVRRARSRGIAVYSVDGDPHMVLAAELPAVVARARAYAAYNAAAQPDARLAGMQFDVEPYLLPETVLAPGERDARYLAMARALRAEANGSGSLQLEFVVPFWWGGKPALLDALAPHADALAVMDYRTDPGQIAEFAQPFLDWAQAHGRRARIALEAGPIDAETQRRYTRAAPGEAADLLEMTLDGRHVLVLLRAPLPASTVTAAANPATGARPYRLAGSRVIDGSATTFHADKDALLRLLPRLEADFGAWDGFGGIAIHELR